LVDRVELPFSLPFPCPILFVARLRVAFDISTYFLGASHNEAFGGVKRFAQRYVYILVRVAIDHYFVSRHMQIDAHIEGISLVLVPVWLFNRDIAARQLGIEMFQRFQFVPNMLF
jgi:hypothetical protein